MAKSIVAYYTWSGKTRRMAEIIAAQAGADILEIVPQTPYSQNYNAVLDQAKEEIRKGGRPPIRPIEQDLSRYDVIYVGTPIWWGTMAPPVMTFLSEGRWDGKIIMPFSTHGGGGKGHADRDMERLCLGAAVKPMYTAYEGGGSAARKEIAAWIAQSIIV